MTVTTLPVPMCSMGDGIDKLDSALVDLDSARYALAYLAEVGPEDGSRNVIECVINTLDDVAKEAKTGLDAVSFEHKAFKEWEAKNARPPAKKPISRKERLHQIFNETHVRRKVRRKRDPDGDNAA